MELKGKTAIVTGGARGIGRGIAVALAHQGVAVAVADLYTPTLGTGGYTLSTEADVQETVEILTSQGAKAIGVQVDVTQADQIEAMVTSVSQKLGPIDILCNNAGVVHFHAMAEMTEADWDAIMDVNLKGVFLYCRAVLPDMMERRQGRIINTSSVAGKTGSSGPAAYAASKSAVIGFTQSLALEMAPYDITVNAVCPGILGTSMWLDHIIEKRSQDLDDDREAALQRFVADRIPLGRPQTPEDIGQAVVYLAQADNVTGISLNVAGGLVMH